MQNFPVFGFFRISTLENGKKWKENLIKKHLFTSIHVDHIVQITS